MTNQFNRNSLTAAQETAYTAFILDENHLTSFALIISDMNDVGYYYYFLLLLYSYNTHSLTHC